MALINCPECYNKVSTDAKTCPHCGFPVENLTNDDYENMNKTKKKKSKKSWLIILIALFLISYSLISEDIKKEEQFEQLKATVQPITLTIDELNAMSSYMTDAKQYIGQYIEITGIIVDIDINNNPNSSFKSNIKLNKQPRPETANMDFLDDIYCHFEFNSEIEKLDTLKEGQEITIVGYCDEWFNGKSLQNCFIR